MKYKELGNKIYTKQDISWNIIDYLLDYMRTVGTVTSDKEFGKCFGEMRKIVDNKLAIPTKFRVDDTFVVVEQTKGEY